MEAGEQRQRRNKAKQGPVTERIAINILYKVQLTFLQLKGTPEFTAMLSTSADLPDVGTALGVPLLYEKIMM